MKYIYSILFILYLFLLVSCWPHYAYSSNITVINNSSFDLRISFIRTYRPYYAPIDDIELKKNSSSSYLITGETPPSAPDPHWYFERVIFTDLNNGEVLNEIIPDNLFKLTDRIKGKKGGERAEYLFEITDDHLLIDTQ